MATIVRGYTFGSTEQVTNAKLHALVDDAVISGIVNADIADGANIDFDKIAGGTIDGSNLDDLGDTPSDAGILPVLNGGTGLGACALGDLIYGSATNTWARLAKNDTASRYLSNTGTSNIPAWAQVNLANGVTGVLPIANGGTGTSTASGGINALLPDQTGNSGKFLTTNGTVASWSALSSGTPLTVVGFTTSGSFTVPAGVTTIKVSLWGGGGGGGSGVASYGGGGGGGAGASGGGNFRVVPGSTYTVTVGSAGSSTTWRGGTGGSTSFVGADYTATANGGEGGYAGNASKAGGPGGAASTWGEYTGVNGAGVVGGLGGTPEGATAAGATGGTGHTNTGGGGAGSSRGCGGQGGDYLGNGRAANGYGAGGGGGGMLAVSVEGNGADGSPGLVIIEY